MWNKIDTVAQMYQRMDPQIIVDTLLYKRFPDFAEILNGQQYFRPHKSYLVNLNHVDRYIRGQGGYLVMRDGTQIPVARTQKPELLRRLRAS